MDNPKPKTSSTARSRSLFRIGAIALLAVLVAAVALDRSGIIRLFSTAAPPLPCDTSTLQIGATKFRIQTLAPKSNGELNVPSGKPNVAFWVQGTNAHYVFGLSPTAQNLTLDKQLAVGQPVKINWADCSSEDYVVSSLGTTIPEQASLLDQSTGGVTVFVPQGAGSGGWLLEGQRPEPLAALTPEPTNPNAISAEISFVDQTASPDGKTLNLKIAIKNTGSKPIYLSESDISLTVANAAPFALTTAQPALPIDVQPNTSEMITLTFPKPAANTGVFKVLDFSVDLYF